MTAAGTRAPKVRRATFTGLVAAEWTKILTVRSTRWTLAAGAVVVVACSALWALALVASDADRFVPLRPPLVAFHAGAVIFGVLGVLAIGAEYATGLLGTALAAAPRRGRYLAAKTVVVTVFALIAGMAASFASFFAGRAVLATRGLDVSIRDEGVLRAAIGGGLFLCLVTIMALGFGTLLRHTAGSIAAVFTVLFVFQVIGGFLPGAWGEKTAEYLPFNAGAAVLAPGPQAGRLAPWTGLGLFALYTLIVLVVAFVVFLRRDAGRRP